MTITGKRPVEVGIRRETSGLAQGYGTCILTELAAEVVCWKVVEI